MMKITTNAASRRQLVAVIGVGGMGFYVGKGVGSAYINGSSIALKETKSLETILSENNSRIPIYEGDSITITF